MAGLGLVVAGSLVVGCNSAPFPDCGFRCGPGGACPVDYECGRDHRCRRTGSSPSLVCSIDAGLEPRPDVVVAIDAYYAMPFVQNTFPMDGDTNVARNAMITVMFSEVVTGVDGNTLTVTSNSIQPITGTLTNSNGIVYDFAPSIMFLANSTIAVRLDSAIRDVDGNMISTTIFSFDVGP